MPPNPSPGPLPDMGPQDLPPPSAQALPLVVISGGHHLQDPLTVLTSSGEAHTFGVFLMPQIEIEIPASDCYYFFANYLRHYLM